MIVGFIYGEDKVWPLGLRDQLRKGSIGIGNDQRYALRQLKENRKHRYFKKLITDDDQYQPDSRLNNETDRGIFRQSLNRTSKDINN